MKHAADIGDLEIILHKAPSQLISKEVLPFLTNYWTYYSGWAALENTENHQFYATGKICYRYPHNVFSYIEIKYTDMSPNRVKRALTNNLLCSFMSTGNVVIDVRRSNFPLLEACMAAAPALAARCVVTVVGHKRLESLLFLASKSK
jgi:hypothetical protein